MLSIDIINYPVDHHDKILDLDNKWQRMSFFRQRFHTAFTASKMVNREFFLQTVLDNAKAFWVEMLGLLQMQKAEPSSICSVPGQSR
jgi:hypothetical protein